MRLSYLRRGSPGQAMVLGSVALLCLTLGVLATLNLGQAVHEKIKLQNTADAAAYSLATLEARTFNYIAFTNRVQVSHYHTAMVVQSYLSYAGYAVGLIGTVSDLMRGLYYGLDGGCKLCPYPPLRKIYCSLARLFQGISRALDQATRLVASVYEQLDKQVAKPFIEAMSLYNRDAMHKRIQLLKAAQLNVHLLTGMQEFVKKNDQQLGWTTQNPLNLALNTVLNSYEYWSAWDKAAGMNPSALGLVLGVNDVRKYTIDASDEDIQKAQAVMAEITNATRSHTDLTKRTYSPGFILGIVGVAGTKMGQTRMVGKGDSAEEVDPKPRIEAIRKQGHYGKCTGDRLASDDYLDGSTGWATVALESVFFTDSKKKLGDGILTAYEKSKHYMYEFNDRWQSPSKNMLTIPWPPVGRGSQQESFKTLSNDDHKWTGRYLAPYFKFKPYPGSEKTIGGPDLKARDYNQPSTWMYLNKRPENFQTEDNQKPWHMKFSFSGPTRGNFVRQGGGGESNNNLVFQTKGTSTVDLDTTIGGERQAFVDFMQGLNVLSRGQVYYHRPDDWREQPNFFNPFWRARLAPIAQVLTNLWERLVGNNLVAGPEASVLQQLMQNFANNLLADFFMATVTSLITH